MVNFLRVSKFLELERINELYLGSYQVIHQENLVTS